MPRSPELERENRRGTHSKKRDRSPHKFSNTDNSKGYKKVLDEHRSRSNSPIQEKESYDERGRYKENYSSSKEGDNVREKRVKTKRREESRSLGEGPVLEKESYKIRDRYKEKQVEYENDHSKGDRKKNKEEGKPHTENSILEKDMRYKEKYNSPQEDESDSQDEKNKDVRKKKRKIRKSLSKSPVSDKVSNDRVDQRKKRYSAPAEDERDSDTVAYKRRNVRRSTRESPTHEVKPMKSDCDRNKYFAQKDAENDDQSRVVKKSRKNRKSLSNSPNRQEYHEPPHQNEDLAPKEVEYDAEKRIGTKKKKVQRSPSQSSVGVKESYERRDRFKEDKSGHRNVNRQRIQDVRKSLTKSPEIQSYDRRNRYSDYSPPRDEQRKSYKRYWDDSNKNKDENKRRERNPEREYEVGSRYYDDSKNSQKVIDNEAKPSLPIRPKNENDTLTSKTGGAYIPPARLRMMQAEITDKSSAAYQRISWEALKKSIHGYINKINTGNIAIIIKELLKENIVRGRGLLCRSIIQAQAASPTFTHVYAALVGAINSRFPNIGELLLKRLVMQFKRGFKRNDKAICISAATFIAHLVNQRVAHEIIALEILTLLVESPTDDSVEVAIAFLKECGQKLTEVSTKGINAIFEMLRNILHEGQLDKRVQYMIEVMFQVRKDGFKDHAAVLEELELVPEEDQFTHLIMLDEATDTQDILNVFKLDPSYEANEAKYKELSKEILGSDADSNSDDGSESGSESGSEVEEENQESNQKDGVIIDNTETNLIALRRTIYLTIHSSLDFEECAHKLMKMQLKPGQEMELCHMFLDCCAEQRTYEKFYGLLAQRFCQINRIYVSPFEQIFKDSYGTAHRLDTNRLRNISKFFAHLLFTDAISWECLDCVKLNEEDTTSSSRIFIKIMFQELAEYMGLGKLNERLKDPTLQEPFSGIFPRDNPKNTRFAINFFTSIGLGGLTDELREHLKQVPKTEALLQQLNVATNNKSSSSSSSSSSDDSSSSSEDSSSEGSSSSSSDDSSENEKIKKLNKKTKSSTSEHAKNTTGGEKLTKNQDDRRKVNEERCVEDQNRNKAMDERRHRYDEPSNSYEDRSTAGHGRRQINEKPRSAYEDQSRTCNDRKDKYDDRSRTRDDLRETHEDRRDTFENPNNAYENRIKTREDRGQNNDDRRKARDEQRETYDGRRKLRDEQRETRDEQKETRDEHRETFEDPRKIRDDRRKKVQDEDQSDDDRRKKNHKGSDERKSKLSEKGGKSKKASSEHKKSKK